MTTGRINQVTGARRAAPGLPGPRRLSDRIPGRASRGAGITVASLLFSSPRRARSLSGVRLRAGGEASTPPSAAAVRAGTPRPEANNDRHPPSSRHPRTSHPDGLPHAPPRPAGRIADRATTGEPRSRPARSTLAGSATANRRPAAASRQGARRPAGNETRSPPTTHSPRKQAAEPVGRHKPTDGDGRSPRLDRHFLRSPQLHSAPASGPCNRARRFTTAAGSPNTGDGVDVFPRGGIGGLHSAASASPHHFHYLYWARCNELPTPAERARTCARVPPLLETTDSPCRETSGEREGW